MKSLVLVFVFALLLIGSEGIKQWLNHDLYPCIKCLCHARSGCWIRQNCARYSIDFDYWTKAGSLVVDLNDPPNNQHSYEKCMKDENCIVGTIIQFTGQYGERDCNCDGVFDCKDRAAIHLKRDNCMYPEFGAAFAARFNECAKNVGVSDMLPREGTSTCSFPKIDDCNCDGKFDCKDRLAIHLKKGPNCERPKFGFTYARRFNECASKVGVDTMLREEGDDNCTVPPAV